MKRVGVFRFEIEDRTYDLAEGWRGKGWEDLVQDAVRLWCTDSGITQGRWVEITQRTRLRGRHWGGKSANLVRTTRDELVLLVLVHQVSGGHDEEGEHGDARVDVGSCRHPGPAA